EEKGRARGNRGRARHHILVHRIGWPDSLGSWFALWSDACLFAPRVSVSTRAKDDHCARHVFADRLCGVDQRVYSRRNLPRIPSGFAAPDLNWRFRCDHVYSRNSRSVWPQREPGKVEIEKPLAVSSRRLDAVWNGDADQW